MIQEEERQDCLEATVHKHLHSYIKKTTGIDADLTLLGERSNCHHDELNSLERKRQKQEVFNRCMEAKMLDLEGTIEGQADHITELEEEVTILRSRKACTCGERVVTTFGSGSQEDPLTLEYAEDEGLNSGLSYHSPIMAQEELLLVIGSLVAQSSDVPEVSCACPVPEVIRIVDDMEMVTVPQENEVLIPVHVEEPPRYNVGIQHASQGCPVAHYHSSTHHTNHHAKQLGSHPYYLPPHFMGQDLRFPCTRELCACILTSGGGADQGGSGDVGGLPWDQESFGAIADSESPCQPSTLSPTSTCYHLCSPDYGSNCLGSSSGLH